LNTIIVQSISDLQENDKYFASYVHLTHVFVLFSKKYPEVRRLTDKKIQRFISNDWNRSKKSCPSIGAIISTLLVSEQYVWTDMAYPALNESFSRNVKWVLNHYPDLTNVHVNKDGRAEMTFKSTIGSLRLMMFHVGYQKILRENMDYWKFYDKISTIRGIPTKDMLEKANIFKKRVYEVDTWKDFFQAINISQPTNHFLNDWLKKAVIHSKKRRYHIIPRTSPDIGIENINLEEQSIYDGIL